MAAMTSVLRWKMTPKPNPDFGCWNSAEREEKLPIVQRHISTQCVDLGSRENAGLGMSGALVMVTGRGRWPLAGRRPSGYNELKTSLAMRSTMIDVLMRYITSDPNILQGEPIVSGTIVAMRDIVQL
jgi:hypothetical protein